MSKINRISKAIFILSIAGLVLSFYLVYYHYALRGGGSNWCNFGQFINCSNILLSKYSDVAGVPLGVFGAIWFVVVTLLIVPEKFHLPRKIVDNSKMILVLWCLVGLAFIASLIAVELVLLNSICVLCTIAHVLAIFISVLVFLDYRK